MANPKGNPQNLLAWKPGQSGNPAGRPKGLKSLLREKYGDDARVLVEELGRLAFDKRGSPSARFRMLAYLIDQHSGRPAQSMSVGSASSASFRAGFGTCGSSASVEAGSVVRTGLPPGFLLVRDSRDSRYRDRDGERVEGTATYGNFRRFLV